MTQSSSRMHTMLSLPALALALVVGAPAANAEVVNVEMVVKEIDLPVDNAGTMQKMWTYDGTVPGPVVRVRQGDTVNFSLKNDKANKQSHSMDFHAAIVDVLDEFSEIKPGDTKKFQFEARYPGAFVYHCGASSMAEHISRGMYGLILVDPRDGFNEDFPKPDREYVIVQGDLFKAGTSAEDRKWGKDWQGALINGKMFHYDPVHDENATLALESKPGERVRFHYVNAQINDPVALHPIAGIWDRVYDNGNPKNVSYGMQTFSIAPAHAITVDLISPSDRPTNNAIVDHAMKRALNGAITVLLNNDDADPKKGRDGNLVIR